MLIVEVTISNISKFELSRSTRRMQENQDGLTIMLKDVFVSTLVHFCGQCMI